MCKKKSAEQCVNSQEVYPRSITTQKIYLILLRFTFLKIKNTDLNGNNMRTVETSKFHDGLNHKFYLA